MKLFESIKEKLKNVSIFIKILGISFGLLLIAGIGFISVTNILMYKTLSDQLERNGIETLYALLNKIEESIIMQNKLELFYVLENTKKNKREIIYLLLLDKYKNVKIIVPEMRITKDFINANMPDNNKENIKVIKTEKGLIHDIAIPIMGGELGVLRCGLSEKGITKLITNNIIKSAIYIFFILIIGIILAIRVIRLIYRPIKNLNNAVNEIAKGNFKIRLKPWALDEIGKLTQAYNKMAESLQKASGELKRKENLRQNLIKRIILAQEEERMRIARELHDSIGQLFSSLKLNLKSLELKLKNKRYNRRIQYLYTLIDKLLDEIYSLIYELRPENLSDFGIIKTVENYIREYEKKIKIKTEFKTNIRKNLKLKFPVEINIYRIIQEALTNIQRHSKAKNVRIEFLKDKNNLLLNIQDDGIGFDIGKMFESAKKPLGVMGMNERTEILGGDFKIFSENKKGTRICIKLPIKKLRYS